MDTRVRLVGLRGAAHLNGMEGLIRCANPDKSDRFIVRLADGTEVSS
jgi:hypothetical protein